MFFPWLDSQKSRSWLNTHCVSCLIAKCIKSGDIREKKICRSNSQRRGFTGELLVLVLKMDCHHGVSHNRWLVERQRWYWYFIFLGYATFCYQRVIIWGKTKCPGSSFVSHFVFRRQLFTCYPTGNNKWRCSSIHWGVHNWWLASLYLMQIECREKAVRVFCLPPGHLMWPIDWAIVSGVNERWTQLFGE